MEQIDWGGEWMPPAGLDVEVHRGSCTWIEKDEWQIGKTAQVMSSFINSQGHGIAAIQFPSGHCECILSACLRKIRTAEQIAAEQREDECERMVEVINASPWGMTASPYECAALLYDYGYRKFEIVPE